MKRIVMLLNFLATAFASEGDAILVSNEFPRVHPQVMVLQKAHQFYDKVVSLKAELDQRNDLTEQEQLVHLYTKAYLCALNIISKNSAYNIYKKLLIPALDKQKNLEK